MPRIKKIIFAYTAIVLFVFLIIIYSRLNPENSHLFPKCPFKAVTGYECPGCGSQRAVHYLLNLNIHNAILANRLLVFFIPYILFLLLIELLKSKSKLLMRLYNIFFSSKAIWSLFIIIVFWWFIRNLK